ncbi:hypothetical protein SAMN05216404_11563 [Nitrosospira multiformis]|uniref:Uncharacterized protein n=1 Tax=Nitrosospira multiformis TaxID=1231 RepID=A0A1H8N8D6_9PROT|nr:hypothetical protein SAMN05216404_11563 [Nitrosospira multiformis]
MFEEAQSCRRGLQIARRVRLTKRKSTLPLLTISVLLLDRRTLHGAKGTEYETVTRIGAHQGRAGAALVEELTASIGMVSSLEKPQCGGILFYWLLFSLVLFLL